jgi:ribosomal protein S18 acetylase RimI-like enzyme
VTPFERIWAFDRRLQERGAPRVQQFDRGVAVYDDTLPRVYDANFLFFDFAVEGLTVAEAERLAESLQGDLRHRKVVLPEGGAEVARGLVSRGWSVSRVASLEYAGPLERDGAHAARAELVDPRAVRGAREEALVGRDADLQRQVANYTENLALRCDGRVFGAFEHGEVGAFCAYFEHDGTGEIDEVTTLERLRRRGLGTAVVEAALMTSLAAGNDLTFLNADEDDWPMRWYERLGFRKVGRRFEVYRTA